MAARGEVNVPQASMSPPAGARETGGVHNRLVRARRFLAIWGPGLLVMVADTDPGNVVTAAQSGAVFGYRLVALTMLLAVPLYFVQEMTVRLGLFSGRGFGQMVREEFGVGWAWLAAATLLIAAVGSLVTEFTGVAGIAETYGVSRPVSLGAAVVLVLAIAASGSYRRIERIALAIGAFEIAFFVVAWQARPNLVTVAHEAFDLPLRNPGFGFLAAALIGAAFNPWMVFYQQSAVVERDLGPRHYRAARWDTAAGALLTQSLSAAVLVASAATLGGGGDHGAVLTSVGQISDAFAAVSPQVPRHVFNAGVLGAALVAVIVSSLAVSWGIGEVLGAHHADRAHAGSRWFKLGYAVAVLGTALFVGLAHDLIWLNIAVQVANALLLPIVLVLLVVLATRPFLGDRRLRGPELAVVIVCAGGAAVAGLLGIVSAVSG